MADPLSKLPIEIRNHFAPAERGGGVVPVGDYFAVVAEAPDYAISRDGMVVRINPKDRTRVGKIMTAWFVNGYPCVDMRAADGTVLKRLVHRVVCRTFHGEPPAPNMEVAHGDGDPANCSASNLRWSTHIDNEADKVAHGTKPARTYAKLTENDVRLIRAAPKYRGVVTDLARRFGVVHQTISDIRRGKNWSTLT